MTKVFIHYSHDSQNHMDRVLDISDRLIDDGIECNIDQYETSPAEGWPRWMINQIKEADFVLVVCTETYKNRFEGKEKHGKGLGVKWESAVLIQELYDAEASNTKFIPVIFSSNDLAHIPVVLRGTTHYKLYTEEGYKALYRHLTNQPHILKPELGKMQSMPPRKRIQRSSEFKDDDNKQNITVYCSRCGAVTGKRSTCVGLYNEHDFQSYKGEVYCSRCGVAAGKRSTCVGLYNEHDFKE